MWYVVSADSSSADRLQAGETALHGLSQELAFFTEG